MSEPKHEANKPPILTPERRAYLYGVMIAAAAVAVGYGLLTIEQAGLWLTLIGALLGLSSGVALANVEKR